MLLKIFKKFYGFYWKLDFNESKYVCEMHDNQRLKDLGIPVLKNFNLNDLLN